MMLKKKLKAKRQGARLFDNRKKPKSNYATQVLVKELIILNKQTEENDAKMEDIIRAQHALLQGSKAP